MRRLDRSRRPCGVALRRTVASVVLLGLVFLGCSEEQAARETPPDPRKVTYRTQTMGTVGAVTLVTADSLDALPHAYLAAGAWRHVDSLMSNWTQTSEVARINREGGTVGMVIDGEVATVLDAALRISAQSDGAFDVTVEPLVRLWGFLGGDKRVPDAGEITAVLGRVGSKKVRLDAGAATLSFTQPGVRIDLGGVAKGYGVDVATQALRDAGVEQALLDLSGNMTAIGAPLGRGHWVVGVRDPRGRYPYFGKLRLRDASIATSGNYEQFLAQDGKQYGHILDPRTGWPAVGLLSATVIADSAMEADAWATALIVLGRDKAIEQIRARPDLHAVLVEAGEDSAPDVVWVSTELGDLFSLDEDTAAAYTVHRF